MFHSPLVFELGVAEARARQGSLLSHSENDRHTYEIVDYFALDLTQKKLSAAGTTALRYKRAGGNTSIS